MKPQDQRAVVDYKSIMSPLSQLSGYLGRGSGDGSISTMGSRSIKNDTEHTTPLHGGTERTHVPEETKILQCAQEPPADLLPVNS